MKLLRMSLNKILEVNDSLKLDEKASAERILMEKEGKGLSYTDIGNKIKGSDSMYRRDDPFTVGETVKKVLHAKKPDRILSRDLFKLLELPEMDIRQRIAANHYYKMSDTKNQRGAHFKS